MAGFPLLLLVLDDKVQHGAAAIGPGAQVEGDAVGRHFDEPSCLGDDRFRALGARVEHVRRVAGSNSTEMATITLSHCALNIPHRIVNDFTRCTL